MCGLVFFSFQRNAQLLVLCLTACKKVSFCWRARTGWRETKACSEIKKPRGICSTDWRCCITLCNVQRGRNLHSKMVIKYIFAKKTGNVSVKKTQSRKNHPHNQKHPQKSKPKKPPVPLVQFSHLEKQSETDLSPLSNYTSQKQPSALRQQFQSHSRAPCPGPLCAEAVGHATSPARAGTATAS